MPAIVNKRDNLLNHLEADQAGDYTPAAFFLHFGSDFKNGPAAIQRHRDYFEFTDMDFVKIQFELDFPDVPQSRGTGYEHVPFLPVEHYQPQLDVVKGLVDALKSQALVVLTLYSPFMILSRMVGEKVLNEGLTQDSEHAFKALETVTDSLLGFVRECRKLGLDGFYHSTQGGERDRFKNPETFIKYVKPTDHRVMNEIDETFEFNILHICDYHAEYGKYEDLTPFLDYPGNVVNVSTEIGGKTVSPAELSHLFGKPFMGGLDRLGPIAKGTEDEARAAARKVLAGAPPKFILGADCTVPGDTPWANLRAAIDEAHKRG
jgi:uroporphyrinogen decarboxylase